MKIVSIVGVRPQFIKLFAISRALKAHHREIIIHTGQHYDFKMSEIFLQELSLPKPHYNLQIGSGTHAAQTGRMLIELESILTREKPDAVIVFGDTNSTLAGALAASKLHIPIVHIEAGLRSKNREMPEEINRIVTDHISTLLFCPTEAAVKNLAEEGIKNGVHCVGDVMYDAAIYFSQQMANVNALLAELKIETNNYILATIHRPANTDSPEVLAKLLKTFSELKEQIVFPMHPRTEKAIKNAKLHISDNVSVIQPVGYLHMLTLEKNARMILTDSGGIQKEAFFFGVPCLTLRNETEWNELVETGWNKIVGVNSELILNAVKSWQPKSQRPDLFGNGRAGEHIVKILEDYKCVLSSIEC